MITIATDYPPRHPTHSEPNPPVLCSCFEPPPTPPPTLHPLQEIVSKFARLLLGRSQCLFGRGILAFELERRTIYWHQNNGQSDDDS